MILAHAHRQWSSYGSYLLDVTGPMMILTQKVTQLAFSLKDGRVNWEEKIKAEKNAKKHPAMKEMQALAITTPPSFLEYTGHCFSFFTFLAGPNHCYVDYVNFIEGKGPNGPPPFGSAVRAAIFKLIVGFFSAFVNAAPTRLFAYNSDYKLLLKAEWVAKTPVLQRIVHTLLAACVIRFKYYFAWMIADGANNLAGLGYNGKKDGSDLWNKITNVDIINVEFATSFKSVLDNWNMQTQFWLKHVCYYRTESVYMTMALSAFWHGLYPGYYLTFLTGALVTNAARAVRTRLRPMFLKAPTDKKASLFYDVLTWTTTMLFLAYLVGPFQSLNFEDSLQLWRTVNFIPHMLLVAVLVLDALVGKPKPAKPAAAPAKKTE
jgi:lysophospholipid acyltransferase 1/2